MNPKSKKVVVFRDTILPISETFIKNQVENLLTYKHIILGSRKLNSSLKISNSEIYVINQGGFVGKFKEIIFKLFGRSAFFIKTCKNFSPDIIHAHFGTDGLLVSKIASKLNLPLLVTFHGFDATVTRKSAAKSFYSHRKYAKNKSKLINNENAYFIAVSDYIKSKLIEQGYPKERIYRHYIGVDTEKFTKVNKTITRENIVLFVGRLVEKKGLEYLIRAFEIIEKDKDVPNTKLVIIGDGELKQKLETFAKSRIENYEFIGSQPSEEVKRYMSKSKVLCVPSIQAKSGDAEGFGMVFAEANASGLPVASFKNGGIPEAIKHNSTGLLCEEKDYKALAENIKILLSNEKKWRLFSMNGVTRTNEEFNLKKQTQILEEIYDDVISRHRKIR